MKRIFLLAVATAGLVCGAAPAWDSSGDGLLTGTCNFRQVMYISDGSGNTPITFIVPDTVGRNPIAAIQVMNGSTLSGTVTAFVCKTTPGVLTFNPFGGIGFAAAEHADYSANTPASPAKPGETIAVYLTGLGAPVPAGGIAVDIAGVASPSIPYAGQISDPGLYQNGYDLLAIAVPDSRSAESFLPVAGQTQSLNGTNRQ